MMKHSNDPIDQIKKKIETDDEFCIGALLALYEKQTADEQKIHNTIHQNGIGFNGIDSGILTGIAKFYIERGFITEKQLISVRRRLVKYTNQLSDYQIIPQPIRQQRKRKTNNEEIHLKAWMDPKTPQYLYASFPYDNELVQKFKGLKRPKDCFDVSSKTWKLDTSPNNIIKLNEWGFEFDDGLKIILEKIKNKKRLTNEDLKLKIDLHPYQLTGVEKLQENDRYIVGDEMGLGKTAQVIGRLSLENNYRAIVICPSILKYNWLDEFNKFMKVQQNITILNGKNKDIEKAEIQTTSSKNYIAIVNYDILKYKKQWIIKHLKPDFIIFDEFQYIKNKGAERTKAAFEIVKQNPRAKVYGLSGTPIVNRPIEFFNILNMIDPIRFKSMYSFGMRYCAGYHNGYQWDFTGASKTQELYNIVSNNYMIRRTKKEVLPELPEKVRTVIPLSIDNQAEYQKAERAFKQWLIEQGMTTNQVKKKLKAETLTQIETLKQIAALGKAKQIAQWVTDFRRTGKKLIVFFWHRQVNKSIQIEIDRLAMKERVPINYCDITGSTPMKERRDLIEEFQTTDKINVLFLQIKAAGMGITLTAADTVLFAELGWTPAEHDQAEDRTHRIGQTNSVNCYYTIAQRTLEPDLLNLIDEKRKVVSKITDGKSDSFVDSNILDNLMNGYFKSFFQ